MNLIRNGDADLGTSEWLATSASPLQTANTGPTPPAFFGANTTTQHQGYQVTALDPDCAGHSGTIFAVMSWNGASVPTMLSVEFYDGSDGTGTLLDGNGFSANSSANNPYETTVLVPSGAASVKTTLTVWGHAGSPGLADQLSLVLD